MDNCTITAITPSSWDFPGIAQLFSVVVLVYFTKTLSDSTTKCSEQVEIQTKNT